MVRTRSLRRNPGARVGVAKGPRLVLFAVSVLAVVGIAVAATFMVRAINDNSDRRAVSAAQRDAVTAAGQIADLIFTYDPANIGERTKAAQARMTATAQRQYDQLIGAKSSTGDKDMVAEVQRRQLQASMTLQRIGLVRGDTSTATVLLFTNQVVTEKGKQLDSPLPARLQFDMAATGSGVGAWKVTNIQLYTDDSLDGVMVQVPSSAAPSSPAPASPASPAPSAPPGG